MKPVDQIRVLYDELMDRQSASAAERLAGFTEGMVHFGPDSEWTHDAIQDFSGDERVLCELACNLRRALIRSGRV